MAKKTKILVRKTKDPRAFEVVFGDQVVFSGTISECRDYIVMNSEGYFTR